MFHCGVLLGRRPFSAFTYLDTAAGPLVQANSPPFSALCHISRKTDKPPRERMPLLDPKSLFLIVILRVIYHEVLSLTTTSPIFVRNRSYRRPRLCPEARPASMWTCNRQAGDVAFPETLTILAERRSHRKLPDSLERNAHIWAQR